MSDLTYEDYQDKIADFDADMMRAASEIRNAANDDGTAYEATWPYVHVVESGPNPYYETDSPLAEFNFTQFRIDIDALASRFEYFVDRADPEKFDPLFTHIESVVKHLELANGYDGMEAVRAALTGWESGAAEQFMNAVLNPFDAIAKGQADLAAEIAIAARSYQEIIGRARLDGLDLARQVKAKMQPGDAGGTDWLEAIGIALLIVSAVASGVGAFAAGATLAARIAWAARTANTGIELLATEERGSEREVVGVLAGDFIPSANGQLDILWEKLVDQEFTIHRGLSADLREHDSQEISKIEFGKPELLSVTSVEDLGDRTTVTVRDIAELKAAGVAHLPAVAQHFHSAHLALAAVPPSFDSLVGEMHVAGRFRGAFHRAVETLDAALIQARDYIYESADNLVEIADGYYEGDTENQRQLHEALYGESGVLDDHRWDLYPPYEPAHVTPY